MNESNFRGKAMIEPPPEGYARVWYWCKICGALIPTDVKSGKKGKRTVAYDLCGHANDIVNWEDLQIEVDRSVVVRWLMDKYGTTWNELTYLITKSQEDK